MGIVNIFLTDRMGAEMEPFEHEVSKFVFDWLPEAGPRRLVEGPVWVFVDWVMDGIAGLEMCRRLRADPRTADAHITMVLEHDSAEDKSRALRAGADDYVMGPINRTMVLDRVLALQTRQHSRHAATIFERGPLTIDFAALLAKWAGKPLALGPNEFRLLRFFAENANQVLTRAQLINGLGKQEPPIDERTVDVWVGRLRRAFKAVDAGIPLRTVRSMGYVLDL